MQIRNNIFLIFIVSLLLIFILPIFYGGWGFLIGFTIFSGLLLGYAFTNWAQNLIKLIKNNKNK